MRIEASDRPRFQAASDQSLLVYFGELSTLKSHEKIRHLIHLLQLEPIPGVRNLQPGYHSLLINFDITKLMQSVLEETLRAYLDRLNDFSLGPGRLRQIPTCYGDEFGPDLGDVARQNRLTPARVIELHASITYIVYFLG